MGHIDFAEIRELVTANNSNELREFVDRIAGTDRSLVGELLKATDTLSVNGRLHLLDMLKTDIPDDVERDGRQPVYQKMTDIAPYTTANADIRMQSLQDKGWPLDAYLISLDGNLAPEPSDRPVLYFVQDGSVVVSATEWKTAALQKGAQVALPANKKYSLQGSATLYALECNPELGGSLSNDKFNDDAKRKKCPCGWSYRIPLVDNGWKFSTHRTVMRGQHDAAHDGFKGHQHKQTPEIYFTDRASPGATITVDGLELPLSAGTLVAIPNGTMHAVDSDEEIVQHIFVGGGHKNNDFWKKNWEPLPK